MRSNITTTILALLVVSAIAFYGCKKDDSTKDSGIATIDNTIYGQNVYYAIGFSFDEGKTLPTHQEPQPDITVHAITDNNGDVTGAYLDTPILLPPFSIAGEFDNSQDASDFFESLLVIGSPEWLPSANPVKENQVWIFKTGKGNYAKFRVISLLLEKRGDTPYAQIKFEWQLQPDGSTIF